MKLQELKKLNIPDKPGVYLFYGPKREIFYIGKATSLKSRVRSYFDADIVATRGAHIEQMVREAKTVKYQTTDSVLEALLLEAQLIKKYHPRYNTKEKDDKSFNYVVVTKEDFPRVLLIRGKELFNPRHKPAYEIKYSFGPFPEGSALKEALKIIRKIIPFRDKCTPGEGKPCFNAQLGLCPGVCSGDISKTEYQKNIRNIKHLFEGKKSDVSRDLKKQMGEAAKRREFEHATDIKRKLFALDHIQDVALIKDEGLRMHGGLRIESYDVAHTSGTSTVGVMTVVENGTPQKSEYRKFKIKTFIGADDTRALTEILDRRLSHTEWPLPRIIVVDGGKAQKNAAERVLCDAGIAIPVVGVVKNERHQPREILGRKDIATKHEKEILLANSEAHRFAVKYHRELRDKRVFKK